MPPLPVKYELYRKVIHFSTSIFPLLYYFYFSKEQFIIISITICVLFLMAEVLRIYVIKIKQIYEHFFSKILRSAETDRRLNGATLLFTGFLMTVLLFEKEIAVVSMLFLSISDSLAAVVGKTWGKTKLLTKTLEGSITFFISALLIAIFFGYSFTISVLIALILTIIELSVIKISDNILIPIVSGLFLTFFTNGIA